MPRTSIASAPAAKTTVAADGTCSSTSPPIRDTSLSLPCAPSCAIYGKIVKHRSTPSRSYVRGDRSPDCCTPCHWRPLKRGRPVGYWDEGQPPQESCDRTRTVSSESIVCNARTRFQFAICVILAQSRSVRRRPVRPNTGMDSRARARLALQCHPYFLKWCRSLPRGLPFRRQYD